MELLKLLFIKNRNFVGLESLGYDDRGSMELFRKQCPNLNK